MMNMMLAFVLGGMAAIGLSFLLEYLDTSVRTAEDLTRRVGGPVLATIPFVTVPKEPARAKPGPPKGINPIIFTHMDPYSAASEAVRPHPKASRSPAPTWLLPWLSQAPTSACWMPTCAFPHRRSCSAWRTGAA